VRIAHFFPPFFLLVEPRLSAFTAPVVRLYVAGDDLPLESLAALGDISPNLCRFLLRLVGMLYDIGCAGEKFIIHLIGGYFAGNGSPVQLFYPLTRHLYGFAE